MRSHWVDPKSVTNVLIRGNFATQRYMENKYHVTKRARYWSDVSISQRMPRIASNNQEPGKNMEQILHLRPQERINPADALISELQKKKFLLL